MPVNFFGRSENGNDQPIAKSAVSLKITKLGSENTFIYAALIRCVVMIKLVFHIQRQFCEAFDSCKLAAPACGIWGLESVGVVGFQNLSCDSRVA